MPLQHDMQVYKNREVNRPRLTDDRTHEDDKICEHRLEINLHTGTHLDASLHVLPDGKTIDAFPLQLSLLPVCLLDLTSVKGPIMPVDIMHADIPTGCALLLKTKNSLSDDFDPEFVYLSKEAAALIAEKKPALVGIDSLGIERGQPGHPTHKALFKQDIWILEGLRLAEVNPEKAYNLHILPLNIKDAEASPVRAVLSERTS